jgi:hypothetical protein
MTRKSTVNKVFRIEPACALVLMLLIAVLPSVAQEVQLPQAGPSLGSEPTPDVKGQTNAGALPVRSAQMASVLESKGEAAARLQEVKLVRSSAAGPLLPVDNRSPRPARVTWTKSPTPPALSATPVEYPSSEPGGPLPSSQADADAISLRNALAQPSGDHPTESFQLGGRVQANAEALPRSTVNQLIVALLDKMPQGGDYRASSESIQRLENAIRKEGDHLAVNAAVATPSFCSSATYLVFVSVLQELHRRGQIRFEPGVAEQLLVSGQHDGVGVWGRWNANGPGTARLFDELHLGRNFTSIEEAQAGDFLKIFWNDQIGAKEFGHSVVYLGHGLNREGVEVVQYWSSNKNGGYGCAEVPRSKVKRTLFSRLDHPERINQISGGLKPDDYLASMLIRSSTPEEMEEMAGIPPSAIAHSTAATSAGKATKGSGADLKAGRKKEE